MAAEHFAHVGMKFDLLLWHSLDGWRLTQPGIGFGSSSMYDRKASLRSTLAWALVLHFNLHSEKGFKPEESVDFGALFQLMSISTAVLSSPYDPVS